MAEIPPIISSTGNTGNDGASPASGPATEPSTELPSAPAGSQGTPADASTAVANTNPQHVPHSSSFVLQAESGLNYWHPNQNFLGGRFNVTAGTSIPLADANRWEIRGGLELGKLATNQQPHVDDSITTVGVVAEFDKHFDFRNFGASAGGYMGVGWAGGTVHVNSYTFRKQEPQAYTQAGVMGAIHQDIPFGTWDGSVGLKAYVGVATLHSDINGDLTGGAPEPGGQAGFSIEVSASPPSSLRPRPKVDKSNKSDPATVEPAALSPSPQDQPKGLSEDDLKTLETLSLPDGGIYYKNGQEMRTGQDLKGLQQFTIDLPSSDVSGKGTIKEPPVYKDDAIEKDAYLSPLGQIIDKVVVARTDAGWEATIWSSTSKQQESVVLTKKTYSDISALVSVINKWKKEETTDEVDNFMPPAAPGEGKITVEELR